MKNTLVIQKYDAQELHIEEIYESLHQIKRQLVKELNHKQQMIEDKDKEIQQLKDLVNQKTVLVEELNRKVVDIQRNNEGNRQLNKKLIHDLVRMQQDIEWYKRTYESRSLLGTLKEKILGRRF